MNLNKLSILPFGTQYYRAPTPLACEWEQDFKNMQEHGFNTVKLWASWRANNPKEGIYDFSDLDRLMQLAEKYNLNVIINIIYDTAPAWFLKKYPESLMVSNDGRTLHPMATACRQMGGTPGPCLHHEEGINIRREFTQKVVSRYKNSSALLCWDLWNEPEHTCAIRRETTVENLTCYCDKSISEFKIYLEHKYKDIAVLNTLWGRNYSDFQEVEVPRLAQTFKDMIDWRLFMTQTITNEAQMRIEATKEIDKDHPAMIHTVTIPFFPLATCGSDDYAIAKHCDIFGNSVGSEPLSAAITISAAEGKMVINSEIHAVGGSTYARPVLNTMESMKKHIFVPLSLGIKGFVFWQYRPERLGLESPAWGLTDLSGNSTPWLEHTVKINNALQKHADTIINSNRPVPKIAIINSQKSQLFDFCVDPNSSMYIKSIKGALALLRKSGYAVDVIGDIQMSKDFLAKYTVIYDPFPYYKDENSCQLLKDWVSNGGLLISEAVFGGYSDSDGMHQKDMPGFGFTEVFGAKEYRITTASSFKNAYDKEWADENQDENIIDITYKGKTYKGFHFYQSFTPNNAEAIANFKDNAVAASVANYGNGKAIIIGSLISYAFEVHNCHENAEFIEDLISSYSNVTADITANHHGVLVDVLTYNNKQLIIVNNGSNQHSVRISTSNQSLFGEKLVNIMTGECCGIHIEGSTRYANVLVNAGDIDVFANY